MKDNDSLIVDLDYSSLVADNKFNKIRLGPYSWNRPMTIKSFIIKESFREKPSGNDLWSLINTTLEYGPI